MIITRGHRVGDGDSQPPDVRFKDRVGCDL